MALKQRQWYSPQDVFSNDMRLSFSSKAQYEKYFKQWGFRKKRTKKDWEIMSQKLETRKRKGRESDVYLEGELMPMKKLQKEISRQGYMTFAEQFNQAQGAYTRSPIRFLVC
jgi:hypothetical protein